MNQRIITTPPKGNEMTALRIEEADLRRALLETAESLDQRTSAVILSDEAKRELSRWVMAKCYELSIRHRAASASNQPEDQMAQLFFCAGVIAGAALSVTK
jgi:dsDNA-binding SOS-regulon protein